MTISLVGIEGSPAVISIWGSGLMTDGNQPMIRDSKGQYSTYLIPTNANTPYLIQFDHFSPALIVGEIYSIEYNGVVVASEPYLYPVPSIAGIYYIDSTRNLMQDLYYNTSKKIPNPTVRTALIGE